MEFSDPMMRHEKYSSGMRIVSRSERLSEQGVTQAQQKLLEERLSRQLAGKIRVDEIAAAIKQDLPDAVKEMKEAILVSDEIPEVQSVTITHIGTLDGHDEPIYPHVVLSRAKALQYEKELEMTLCVEDMNEECNAVVCRMRHLDAYVTRVCRAKIANKTAQMQQNTDQNTEIESVIIRANIADYALVKKCKQICSRLYEGSKVRITAKNCITAQDSAYLLQFICQSVKETSYGAASTPYVSFHMGVPMFSKLAASCILTPLEEGSTQLIEGTTMMQMAVAVDRADDEDFERECSGETASKRVAMEESRRRMFYGLQEDFLSRKQRDPDLIEKYMPWEEPTDNKDAQQLEYDAAMQQAGENKAQKETYAGNLFGGAQQYQSPQEYLDMQEGTPQDAEMDLSPGTHSAPRTFFHAASPF